MRKWSERIMRGYAALLLLLAALYVRRGKSALLLVNIKTGENRIVRIDRYA